MNLDQKLYNVANQKCHNYHFYQISKMGYIKGSSRISHFFHHSCGFQSNLVVPFWQIPVIPAGMCGASKSTVQLHQPKLNLILVSWFFRFPPPLSTLVLLMFELFQGHYFSIPSKTILTLCWIWVLSEKGSCQLLLTGPGLSWPKKALWILQLLQVLVLQV